MNMTVVRAVARYELTINVRNRWTTVFAVIFGLLVIGIAYFGLMAEGFTGMQDFSRTSASLLNLVLYIVPLIALTMGTLSFTGDRGGMELLFSQPLSRSEVVVGKMIGVFWAIAIAVLLGFALAGVLVVAGAGPEGLSRYAGMVGFSLLLAFSFLSLALLVSTLARRKQRAIGFALFFWFFFVLFYDLLAIGLSLFLRGESANVAIFASVFGNPVDLVRVATLILLDNVTIFGASGAALMRFLGGTALAESLVIAALIVWIVGPVAISCLLLKKQDI